jgi:hypothetical protein
MLPIAAAPAPAPAPPPRRSPPASAPVTREIPTGTPRPGTVQLTPFEREAARIAGVSDVEYARGKIRLAQEKAAGRYLEPN